MSVPESMKDQFTDEQWESLTEEEQNGMLEDDGEEEEEENEDAEALAALEAKKVAAAAETAAQPAKKEGEALSPEEIEAAAAAEAAKAEPEKQDAPVTRRPRGVIDEKLPEDFTARVTANEAAMDALEEKYNDGDLAFSEFRKEQRKLEKESRDLDTIKLRAELSEESATNAFNQHWEANIDAFLPLHPELKKNNVKMEGFDSCLREVTAPVMAAGGMPGLTEINKAYAMWCEEFGFTPTGAQQEADTAAQQKSKTPIKAPPVLGGLPASTQTGTEDGRWAILDRLAESDPMKYEAELAKMSAADTDAYLQA